MRRQIAVMLGISEANCRQPLRGARQHVRIERPLPRDPLGLPVPLPDALRGDHFGCPLAGVR